MEDFIEFPIFTGVSGDLRPWISWLEAFFVREKFKKLEKMNLAQSLLEGEAEAWFYLIQKTLIFYSWRELKDKLLLRFGDVADSDRIRLIAEQDRFLMEIRDEARIRRRKTTSIPVKDTIRETITVVEETSEIVDGNLAERASEKKLVSPNQVTIWDTEPEALIPTDTIPVMNLTESRDSISATKLIQEANCAPVMDGGVSLEKEISCQAVEYIHTIELFSAKESMEKAESSSAKDESITQTQVPVSSLEPGLRLSSEIIDVSVAWPSEMVSHNRVHSQAGFECVKNKNNTHHVFDELLRMLHDPGGKRDEHSDDIFETEVARDNVPRTQMDIVADSMITAPDNVVSSLPDVALYTDVISIRQTMQPEGWDEACAAAIDALEGTGTCIVTSLPAGCGWLVFDRGKNGQLQWPEIQTISWYKAMVADPVTQAVLNLVPNAARFGFLSVLSLTHAVHLDVKQDFMRTQALTQSHRFKVAKFGRLNNTRVTVMRVLCLLGTLFGSTSVKKQKFGKNWWYKFKHSLWQRECGRELLVSEAILAVRFDVLDRDESEHSWMLAVEVVVAATVVDVDLMSLWRFSKAFVHLSPSYKLEDKLGLQGVSIDTIHQPHYRKNKKEKSEGVQIKGKTLLQREALPF